MSNNPDSIRWIVALMALYLHVGPFSREVIAHIEKMMAAIEPVVIAQDTLIESAQARNARSDALV